MPSPGTQQRSPGTGRSDRRLALWAPEASESAGKAESHCAGWVTSPSAKRRLGCSTWHYDDDGWGAGAPEGRL